MKNIECGSMGGGGKCEEFGLKCLLGFVFLDWFLNNNIYKNKI